MVVPKRWRSWLPRPTRKFAFSRTSILRTRFEPEFEVVPRRDLQKRAPCGRLPDSVPNPKKGALEPAQFQEFVRYASGVVAELLDLRQREHKTETGVR